MRAAGHRLTSFSRVSASQACGSTRLSFGRLDQRGDASPVGGAPVVSGEERILAAEDDGSHHALDGDFACCTRAMAERAVKAYFGPLSSSSLQASLQFAFEPVEL
jgi:hypothetical protein